MVSVKVIDMRQVTKKEAIKIIEDYNNQFPNYLKNPTKFLDEFFNNWSDDEFTQHEGYVHENYGIIELYHGSQFHSEITYKFN